MIKKKEKGLKVHKWFWLDIFRCNKLLSKNGCRVQKRFHFNTFLVQEINFGSKDNFFFQHENWVRNNWYRKEQICESYKNFRCKIECRLGLCRECFCLSVFCVLCSVISSLPSYWRLSSFETQSHDIWGFFRLFFVRCLQLQTLDYWWILNPLLELCTIAKQLKYINPLFALNIQ